MKKIIVIFIAILLSTLNAQTWNVKTRNGNMISYFWFIENNKRYIYSEIADYDKIFCVIDKNFIYSVIIFHNQYIAIKQKNTTGNIDDDIIHAGELVKEDLLVLLELEKIGVKDKLKKSKSAISTKALELITKVENKIHSNKDFTQL